MGITTTEVLALRAGEATFRTFYDRHAKQMRWMAAYIDQRWMLPCWSDREDLLQEVAMGAWRAAQKFDPNRGVPAQRYVTYNAISTGKKAANRWRKAGRKGDNAPSRLDAHLGDKNPPDVRTLNAVEQFEQVQALEQTCRGDEERLVLRALVKHGSVRGAASALYADPTVRLQFEYGSSSSARQHVWRVARELARRAA